MRIFTGGSTFFGSSKISRAHSNARPRILKLSILSFLFFISGHFFVSGTIASAEPAQNVPADPVRAPEAGAKEVNEMNHKIFYTGLKAVDFFAPIPLGGDILIAGELKSAPRVLGTEMALRLANRPGQAMHVAVFLDSAVEDAAAYEKDFKESVSGSVELITVPQVSAEDIRKRLSGFRSEMGNAVFGVSKNESFISGFRKAVAAARGSSAETQLLTSFVVTEGLFPEGFDDRIQLIRALAVEGIYPPLDVRNSSSSVLAAAPSQRAAAESAKTVIADVLKDLQPGSFKDPAWSYNQDRSKHPAIQALRFISQPYFCAEPYTGLKSAYVPIEETIDSFRRILSGAYAETPIQSFYMKNSLPDAAAQASN